VYFNAAINNLSFFSLISAFLGMCGILSLLSCHCVGRESGASFCHLVNQDAGIATSNGFPVFITFHICAQARGTTRHISNTPPPKPIHLPLLYLCANS